MQSSSKEKQASSDYVAKVLNEDLSPISTHSIELDPSINIGNNDNSKNELLGLVNKPIALTWSNINVSSRSNNSLFARYRKKIFHKKHHRGILSNVSGIARPGEVLAIMGASGAGKTSLLNVLNHRNREKLKVKGSVRINGHLVKSVEDVSSVSGYVQQDDVFTGYLTVYEHLLFQSMLRIERSVMKRERLARVDQVINDLNLKKCQNTLIGVFGTKGISGGEKRRLAFASEILTNPSILFCDEPTSGLDSYMAVSVAEAMRSLALKGKTIVCTIHQPSSEIFQMFDRLCLLSEGRLAYIGDLASATSFFSSQGFLLPPNYNPADFFIKTLAMVPHKKEQCLDTINKICDGFDQSIFSSVLNTEIDTITTNLKASPEFNRPDMSEFKKQAFYKTNCFNQLKWLLWRNGLGLLRDPFSGVVQIVQTFIVALMFGLIYFRLKYDQQGVMDMNGFQFMCMCNMGFSTMFFVVNVFPVELPIFYREHESGMYRVLSYYCAKVLTDMPNFIVLPMIFMSIAYWMANLNPLASRFFICCAVIVLVVQCSLAFGTFLSIVSPSTNVALALAGPILVPLMIFSGFLLNYDSIPRYFIWLRYLSWFGYANELLVVNQWTGVDNISCPFNEANETQIGYNGPIIRCFTKGEQIIDYLRVNPNNYYMNFGLLAALIIFWRVAAFLILLLKSRHK